MTSALSDIGQIAVVVSDVSKVLPFWWNPKAAVSAH